MQLSKLMRSIMPVELAVESVDGTWKLNQNKEDSVRLRAARHAESDGYGHEAASLARLMRSPPID